MSLRNDGARLCDAGEGNVVAVAKDGFEDPNAAMDRLFELFPDKYPVQLASTEEAWTFELSWPRQLLEPIDPFLAERGLACYGLELSELNRYFETRWYGDIPFVFSLFHSFALLAPSLVGRASGQIPKVVVHVDSHHDLSQSLLRFESTDILRNDAFTARMCLSDPDSVEGMIAKGILNKANFLTGYMLGSPGRRIYHIEANCTPDAFSFQTIVDEIPLGNRLVLIETPRLLRAQGGDEPNVFESSALPEEISLLFDSGIWLDVDLDAFCNRFDGDSDNFERLGSFVEAKQLNGRLDGFLERLEKVKWREHIRAVSVAASPGFFHQSIGRVQFRACVTESRDFCDLYGSNTNCSRRSLPERGEKP